MTQLIPAEWEVWPLDELLSQWQGVLSWPRANPPDRRETWIGPVRASEAQAAADCRRFAARLGLRLPGTEVAA